MFYAHLTTHFYLQVSCQVSYFITSIEGNPPLGVSNEKLEPYAQLGRSLDGVQLYLKAMASRKAPL